MQPTPPDAAHLSRGYAIALISAGILSTTAIFIRYLTQTYQIPALVLAFWREIFVALTLLLVMLLIRRSLIRVDPRHLPYLLAYGFVLAIFNSLWTLSVALNGAAVATVLVYCSAAFTALLGWWLLKERLDGAKILAVIISLGGCLLVSGAWDSSAWQGNLVGILTGILAGLGYAAYSLMGRSAAQRGLSTWTTVLYIFGFGSIFLLLFNLLPGGLLPGAAQSPGELLWLGKETVGWIILIVLAAGPTLTGYGTYNLSLSYLPSSIVNLIATTEPPFTAAIAFFFLHERMTLIQIAGGVLILSAVVLLRIHDSRLAKRTRPA
ncbi:MAG TPA: EamA family transporter [Anaerolineae bacterium]|nr:EamA family transporter [Anaerolineae bacterium]